MKTASFFHRETGLFSPVQLTVSDDLLVGLNAPSGHAAIEGHHDHLSKRVVFTVEKKIDEETGEPIEVQVPSVVEYQPPQPSSGHEWSEEAKRWRLSAAAAEKINRSTGALARIAQLEASQHRRLREYAIGTPGAFEALKAIDDEIQSLREHL